MTATALSASVEPSDMSFVVLVVSKVVQLQEPGPWSPTQMGRSCHPSPRVVETQVDVSGLPAHDVA